MEFLFIHSACVAVALLLPCALCDRIILPLQSNERTSTPISTKKRIEKAVEGEAGQKTEEDQEIEILIVQEIEMIRKIKNVKGIENVAIEIKIADTEIETVKEKKNANVTEIKIKDAARIKNVV